ncbi:MAG: hypothetical protein J6386_08815 [Candidatus Synoicihabitans palmerolidicus]|nr:hypothetical protein [Candidatus Synoicihabitans palmerolidicus]
MAGTARRRKGAGVAAASPARPSFATLRLGAMSPPAASLEVRLPDGTRLRGDDPIAIAALVKALPN